MAPEQSHESQSRKGNKHHSSEFHVFHFLVLSRLTIVCTSPQRLKRRIYLSVILMLVTPVFLGSLRRRSSWESCVNIIDPSSSCWQVLRSRFLYTYCSPLHSVPWQPPTVASHKCPWDSYRFFYGQTSVFSGRSDHNILPEGNCRFIFKRCSHMVFQLQH